MRGAGGIDVGISTRRLLQAPPCGNGDAMIARRALILEDSLIIAMEAEEVLREIGVETIEITSNLEQAIEAVSVSMYDFALLDVNLGEAMSFGFARSLIDRGIPFGFVSGYSDTLDFPADMQGMPLLVKPFDEKAMRHFLEKLFPQAI